MFQCIIINNRILLLIEKKKSPDIQLGVHPAAASVQGAEHWPIRRKQTVEQDLDLFRAQHIDQQGFYDEGPPHRSAAHVRSLRY